VQTDASLSLLAERQQTGPPGRSGGGPGRPGACYVNGVRVPGMHAQDLRAGDVVRVETPGGGGWGVSGSAASGAPRDGLPED
jgi:N-methylhydantoinase B